MPTLNVQGRDGSEKEIVYSGFPTAMEVIRDAGLDELLALCGGACSCATCHVHVSAADWSRLASMSEDESDLLDTSSHRTEYSRLSCQISLGPDLDGLTVTIAEED